MKKRFVFRRVALMGFAGIVLVASLASAQINTYTGAENPEPGKIQMQKPEMDYSHKYLPPSGREGGETIANAVMITGLPFYDTGNTCDNINDYDEACPYTGSTSPDVVYSFAPTTDIMVDIDLCNSLYDTKVYVYENTAGNPIACNDDAFCGYSGYQSRLESVCLTSGNTYYIIIDGYSGDCGDYDLAITAYDPLWCLGYCVPGSTPEGEGDIPDEGVDNFNGGCNSPPLYPFSPIIFDQVICGRSNTYLVGGSDFRDTDWYEITVTEAGVLYWTGMASFELYLFILDDDCNTIPVLASGGNTGNCSQVQLSYPVEPGNYYLWAGPSSFSGLPDGENYNVIATFNGPPPPDWCTSAVPVSNWALFVAMGLIAVFVIFRLSRKS